MTIWSKCFFGAGITSFHERGTISHAMGLSRHCSSRTHIAGFSVPARRKSVIEPLRALCTPTTTGKSRNTGPDSCITYRRFGVKTQTTILQSEKVVGPTRVAVSSGCRRETLIR